MIEFQAEAEPLLPAPDDLRAYEIVEGRTREAAQEVRYWRDQATMERANSAHRRLVNLVAKRLQQAGSLPRCNQLIDLAARVNDQTYIFEMKSTNDANVRSQLRSGVSQLYEYRYLQNSPEAMLILVIENPLPIELNWMHLYLEQDREISLLWDGNANLYASLETQNRLSFLW